MGEFRVLEKKLSSVVGLGCRDGVAMVSNESSRRRLEIQGIDWKSEISSSFVRILESCMKYEQVGAKRLFVGSNLFSIVCSQFLPAFSPTTSSSDADCDIVINYHLGPDGLFSD